MSSDKAPRTFEWPPVDRPVPHLWEHDLRDPGPTQYEPVPVDTAGEPLVDPPPRWTRCVHPRKGFVASRELGTVAVYTGPCPVVFLVHVRSGSRWTVRRPELERLAADTLDKGDDVRWFSCLPGEP